WAADTALAVRILLRLGHPPEEAQDLAQEVILRGWRHRQRIRNRRAWIAQAARRRSLASRQKEARRARIRGARAALGAVPTADCEPLCEALEIQESLRAALPLLSPIQRRVLRLWSRNVSLVNIAGRLGLSASTVRYHRDQGLARLLRLLGESAC